MLKLLPHRIRKPIFVFIGLLRRPMTLGVRMIVQNEREHVLLVRHTYVEGWHFPGGGVERGQVLLDAVAQELKEEVNVGLTGEARLFQVYRNPNTSRYDHVALFICPSWEFLGLWRPDHEIAEIGFFPLHQLPQGVSRATKERVEEVFGGHPLRHIW